jgi:Putative  PD-(D/E)XK family member, (DUF4420)
MALQNEVDQLTAAWRALDQRSDGRGWSVIDIVSSGNCSVMAGRKGPGNEETLLVGISGVSATGDFQLPRGQGFLVVKTELPGQPQGMFWLAVVRQQGGQLPLFTLMAADLVTLLRRMNSESGSRIYIQLIARIKSWQQFMSRERPQLLTAEEEVGLFGELVILRDLIAGGVAGADAVEAWSGPDPGLHDFMLGTGAIEVKTTVAPAGFIARIANLDQFDNSLYQPLYLGAVRLAQSETGHRLPEIIDGLAEMLTADAGAFGLLTNKLGSAGYMDAMRDHYSRRFICSELTYRLITEQSPRLTRASVPAQILEAMYSLDVDAFPVTASAFSGISASLRMPY